jgi:hypothetical protein
VGVEQDFQRAMVRLYETARDDLGYNATYFKRMLADHGGVGAAHRLLATTNPSEGFATLWEHGRLDLSVEAHVIREDFQTLFSDEELEIARQRLTDYGYRFPKPHGRN